MVDVSTGRLDKEEGSKAATTPCHKMQQNADLFGTRRGRAVCSLGLLGTDSASHEECLKVSVLPKL